MRAIPLFAAVALIAPCHAQTYTLTELPTPAGFTRAFPQDLTYSGKVLIIYEASDGSTRTHVWENGSSTDLGVFQGLARNEGNEINESGVVAGHSWAATGFPTAAWRWQNGVFTPLGSLGGYANSGGVNEAGHATGWASTTTAGTGGSTLAFFHDGATMMRLGQTVSGHYADASGINSQGIAVGSFLSRRRVSFDGAYIGDMAGGLHELPTLGGLDTNALQINDAGQVVGSSETGQFGANNRFLLHAFVWSDGIMRDVGTLPGRTQSVAIGLNNAGDIVGDSFSDSFNPLDFRAVLWPQGGPAIDLNERIPAGSGVQLNSANDINSSGQIIATGVVNGETQRRAYLLAPAP